MELLKEGRGLKWDQPSIEDIARCGRRAALVVLATALVGASTAGPAASSGSAAADVPTSASTVARADEWFVKDAPTDGSGAPPHEVGPESATPGAGAAGTGLAGDAVGGTTVAPRLVDGWGYAIPMVRLTGGDHNVLRRGPGDEFAIVAVQPEGAEFRVLAKKDDWYSVAISETTSAWIHSALCEEFEDLSHLEMRPNPRLFSRTGAFTLTGYAGGYAYDRKSNSVALGGRVGYYVFDFLEVEGGVSWTHINRPAEVVESLFNLRLEAEEFHMLYYNLGLRLELLPGRQMVPYLVGGAGASILEGRTESSWNYGGGTALFLTKTTATRWELRSYRFDAGFDRARRTNHNIEFSFGTSVLF